MILTGPFHLTILCDSDTRIQFQLGISVYFSDSSDTSQFCLPPGPDRVNQTKS